MGDRLSLENLQKWMQSTLIPSRSSPHTYLPESFHQGSLDQIIKPSKRLSAQQHLAIYQRSYVARLRDCMAQQFSALKYALGHELFEMFVDEYLHAYPSSSHTLMDLGKEFARFLNETRPDADQDEKEGWPDFMIELAEFEYQICLLFDRETESESIAIDGVDWRLNAVVQLFAHSYPISWYYRAFLNDKAPELPFAEPSYSVILRKEFKLGLFDLNPLQYHFMVQLLCSRSFAAAKKHLAQLPTAENQFEFEQVWPLWLAKWQQVGIVLVG